MDGFIDKEKFLSGGYVIMEAATGAEDAEKETQPTYSVGDIDRKSTRLNSSH